MIPLAESVREGYIELVGLIVIIRITNRFVLVVFQGIYVAETEGRLLHREIEPQRRADLEASAAAVVTGRDSGIVRYCADVIIIESAESGGDGPGRKSSAHIQR